MESLYWQHPLTGFRNPRGLAPMLTTASHLELGILCPTLWQPGHGEEFVSLKQR